MLTIIRWINLLLSPLGYRPLLRVKRVSDTYIDYIKEVNLNGSDYMVYYNNQANVSKVEHFFIDDEKCPFCTEELGTCVALTNRSDEIQLLLQP